MQLRSKQMKEDFQQINKSNPRKKAAVEKICQIPIQHIQGPFFKKLIYIPQQKIIIGQKRYRQLLAAKIVRNKMETSCDANEIIPYYQYVIVSLKHQFLIGIEDDQMIKLQLSNFHLIERVKLDFCLDNYYNSYIIQDEQYENNTVIIFTTGKFYFRRIKDLKLQFYKGWIYLPTNFKLNKYCFSYYAKDNCYIHNNLRGKMIRKMKGPFNRQKNLESIIVVPNLQLNNEHCTQIVNPNSMKVICQLFAKENQYVDSILIQEEKILIILNYSNILAYDTNNYQILEEVQLPNKGIPYKLNYNKSQGIQIFYEGLKLKILLVLINKKLYNYSVQYHCKKSCCYSIQQILSIYIHSKELIQLITIYISQIQNNLMKLRSQQLQEEEKRIKKRNKVIVEQICSIKIQHVKGTQLEKMIYIPKHKIIIAQTDNRKFFAGKIENNKIVSCGDINTVLSQYAQVIVNLKQQIFKGIKYGWADIYSLDELFEPKVIKFDSNMIANFQQQIVQDDRCKNNNYILYNYKHLQFRRIKDLKVKFQRKCYPTDLRLNRYFFSYVEYNNYYMHTNLTGKIIRKRRGPYISQKNLNTILVAHTIINQQHCTVIINPYSMRIICQLQENAGQYLDSILLEKQNILIILNKKNIAAYDTINYKLLDQVQLPNYGTPYKLNFHKSIGIQILYKIQKKKRKL
ncbi:hypothetical protein pb186bvf_008740 [Paramecium bursaria]